MDLSDPDFRRPALANSKQVLAGYEALIRDAIDAGELAECDEARLARTLHAVVGGSLINWAIHRDGALATIVRRDIETLLGPLRMAPRTARQKAKSPSGIARARASRSHKR